MMIAQDREALLFITTSGEIQAKVDGDCCSQSWIENVELPVNGFPATVTAAEERIPGFPAGAQAEKLQVLPQPQPSLIT